MLVRSLSGVALFVTLAAVCSPAGAQTMTVEEIQKTLAGKRVSLSCVDGTRGSGRYTMAKNFGIITGTYQRPDGTSSKDTGRVRAEGNQLCLKFQKFNGGQEGCFGIVQRAPGSFQFTALGGLVKACDVNVI
jgi:hypothetical protein